MGYKHHEHRKKKREEGKRRKEDGQFLGLKEGKRQFSFGPAVQVKLRRL